MADFSICTLVTRPDQYAAMRASFGAAGFGNCEFLPIDNSGGNTLDGYQGVNRFLADARGEYVIICHQDVLLDFDNRADLEKRLAELTEIDPTWAICGNAGKTARGHNAIRISDPHGADTRIGSFPARVVGLDENFVVVRKGVGLSVSERLTGFHLYATALCCSAHALGRSAYVIDFHLRHLSGGSMKGFHSALRNLARYLANEPKRRLVGNTCGATVVGGPSWALAVKRLRAWVREQLRDDAIWDSHTWNFPTVVLDRQPDQPKASCRSQRR